MNSSAIEIYYLFHSMPVREQRWVSTDRYERRSGLEGDEVVLLQRDLCQLLRGKEATAHTEQLGGRWAGQEGMLNHKIDIPSG